jgi:glutaredoxin
MKHSAASRSRIKGRLIGTLFILGSLFLIVYLTGNLPATNDSLVRGSLHLAEAEEVKKAEASPTEPRKPSNQVIVYITSWCPACRMTTDYLTKKKIPYVVKDVEKNEKYMKEMIQKVGGYRGVPVLDINGRILLGFNPYVLDELAK